MIAVRPPPFPVAALACVVFASTFAGASANAVTGGLVAGEPAALPVVIANDNRHAAGVRHGDTVRIRLVARMARWFPEDSLGPHVDVLTLGEEGKAPQIPAPLLRVSTGTVLDVTIANTLSDSALWAHGLGTRPAVQLDSTRIAPGATARFVFAVGAPGTYTYVVWPGVVDRDRSERETASGAFVVDAPGAGTDDRIFVMNIWGQQIDSVTGSNALAINGKSWPYTERINTVVGDTLRWRVVNATMRPHPMHLHGVYFRMSAKGDGLIDRPITRARQRLAVTETMAEMSTMAIAWAPQREGNWLFHCHIGFHVTPGARLDQAPMDMDHRSMSHDPAMHMAGLVLGIVAKQRPGTAAQSRGRAKTFRLIAQEGPKRFQAARFMTYMLDSANVGPNRSSTLVLHVGEPTDITVVNRLNEATAVHWHGIELESYSDGVAGFSGSASRLAPPIAPGDSFVAHLTLRRPGTFIYHTHLNDIAQLESGMYGGIIVLPTGQRFDPGTDHLFVAGWDGDPDPPHVLVNGDSVGRPMTIAAGVRHRFRFVNIGVAATIDPLLLRDSSVVTWRLLAQDGADLPAPRMIFAKAGFPIDVGQTADFTWLPDGPGEYRLSIGSAGRAGYFTVPITVR